MRNDVVDVRLVEADGFSARSRREDSLPGARDVGLASPRVQADVFAALSRRVVALPGVSAFRLGSLRLSLLGTLLGIWSGISVLMLGLVEKEAPYMEGFVINAGLVAARPRPAGPRGGEGGRC